MPTYDVINPAANIALVAVDMDGTFLDGNGEIPAGAWEVLEQLAERGINFVPASGRQFATLSNQFAPSGQQLSIIAENGTVVMHGEQEIFASVINPELTARCIKTVRAQDPQLDAGLVLCGRRTAYIERSDTDFAQAIAPYYHQVSPVEDLLAVEDQIIKMAIHVNGQVNTMAQALSPLADELQVVISGLQWVDLMNLGVHKGGALAALQSSLGITAQQTAVFGDYPNDLQLMAAGEHSFAMANAHPQVAAAAKFTAPPNTEHGVLQVLRAYLKGATSL